MENIIRIFQFEFETYHSWLLDNVWYRNWATRLIFLHSAVFMPHRFLVPGRQTNVGGRQTRPTVINFPRVNVSTRPHRQRLLFVHQFSIHFRSPCDRFGWDASRKSEQASPPPPPSRNRTGIPAKPRLAAFNMWRPCAIVRGRSAPDTSASWLASIWRNIVIPQL